jgi:hypothetical protein
MSREFSWRLAREEEAGSGIIGALLLKLDDGLQ